MKQYISGLGILLGIILLLLGYQLLPWDAGTLETYFSFLWVSILILSIIAFYKEYRRVKELRKFRKNWQSIKIVKEKRSKSRQLRGNVPK